MKTTLKLFVLFFYGVTLSGCKKEQVKDIKQAQWIIGTWMNETSKQNIYETWSLLSSNELLGKSYLVKQRDTIVLETIQLLQEKEGLSYIPTVKNQNKGLSTRFTLKTISETQLIFENPKHDFPQTISYTKITSDSLVAKISGFKNGLKKSQIFPMKLLK